MRLLFKSEMLEFNIIKKNASLQKSRSTKAIKHAEKIIHKLC